MPPSAWLLIAPWRQESRTSGTDIADRNRKHEQRFPFKHGRMTVSEKQRDSRGVILAGNSDRQAGEQLASRAWMVGDSQRKQLELNGYYPTCPEVRTTATLKHYQNGQVYENQHQNSSKGVLETLISVFGS